MGRIYYDTEFIDDGKTIELISLGMIDDQEQELYLINSEVNLSKLLAHDWLRHHVAPYLPIMADEFGNPCWDSKDQDAVYLANRNTMQQVIRRFVLTHTDPQLWAWYGAYDHVALAQLFGRMVDLPTGFPMWTNDLHQEHIRLGEPPLPVQGGSEHHALADARWNKQVGEFLDDFAVMKNSHFETRPQ